MTELTSQDFTSVLTSKEHVETPHWDWDWDYSVYHTIGHTGA